MISETHLLAREKGKQLIHVLHPTLHIVLNVFFMCTGESEIKLCASYFANSFHFSLPQPVSYRNSEFR